MQHRQLQHRGHSLLLTPASVSQIGRRVPDARLDLSPNSTRHEGKYRGRNKAITTSLKKDEIRNKSVIALLLCTYR